MVVRLAGYLTVALLFSAAKNRTANMSKLVQNISMKSPWTTLVPDANLVVAFRSPGRVSWTNPAPAIAPAHWAMVRRIARTGVMTPTKSRPRETAGLKRPPLTRKKIHAQIARLKPNARAM